MKTGGWLSLVAFAASGGCLFDNSDASCPGQARTLCVTGCGSDAVGSEICRDGSWACPQYSFRGDLVCPPGTCFNNPYFTTCCNAVGDKTSMICESKAGTLPTNGVCPSGYTACSPLPIADAGALDAAPPKDAAELLNECFVEQTPCDLCCEKYFNTGSELFLSAIKSCACGASGPCTSACSVAFCADQGMSPTCRPCLLNQLTPGAPCSGEVSACTSNSSCANYVDCMRSCPDAG